MQVSHDPGIKWSSTDQAHDTLLLPFNLLHAANDYSRQNFKNNFFQSWYILMIQKYSLDNGDVFQKLKHAPIIIGCWDIH